jgi:hypothetical protein
MSDNEVLYQEYPLDLALENFGIATVSTCRESEPGFLEIEFPSADDAEEFLTLLLVSMGDLAIREPEIYDGLYSRMMERVSRNSWKYDAHPMDCRDLLGPEGIEKMPIVPYAVALRVSLRFPAADYPKILELIAGSPRCR